MLSGKDRFRHEQLGDILVKNGRRLDDLPAFEREVFSTIYDKLLTAETASFHEEYTERCMRLLLRAWDNHIRINGGMPESWAAGLLHAASKTRANGEKRPGKGLKYSEVSRIFGVSCMTVSNQSKKIRQYLAAS
ncbi:MAG: DUF6398 domain-containing protein [Desulfovibrionaceae bacterium]|nr:DUF6398 domain-containing protein [Desulfovibrionaceae bacterium]